MSFLQGVECRQVVESSSCTDVVRPKDFLVAFKGLQKKQFRFFEVTLCEIKTSKILEAGDRFSVLGAESFFSDL